MIKVSGSATLSFLFPADRMTTYDYFSDMHRLVSHLNHIEIVRSDPDRQYRLYYNTIELGSYHIHVYCDVQVELSPERRVLQIIPISNLPDIQDKITLNSTTTRGFYSSEAIFYDEDEQTRIEYSLTMKAKPPRPKGMRFMPQRMVDNVAKNITTRRIREIAEGFITSSLATFPKWQAEYEALKTAEG